MMIDATSGGSLYRNYASIFFRRVQHSALGHEQIFPAVIVDLRADAQPELSGTSAGPRPLADSYD